jgi:hypothetical protein
MMFRGEFTLTCLLALAAASYTEVPDKKHAQTTFGRRLKKEPAFLVRASAPRSLYMTRMSGLDAMIRTPPSGKWAKLVRITKSNHTGIIYLNPFAPDFLEDLLPKDKKS